MNRITCQLITNFELQLPLFLESLGYQWNQDHVTRLNGFPYFQWIQCTEGEGKFILGGHEYLFSPGQGLILYPNVPHEYYPVKEPWIVDWISIGGYAVNDLFNGSSLKKSGVYSISNADTISANFKNIIKIEASDTPSKTIAYSKYIYEILLDLFLYASSSNNYSVNENYLKISPVLDYISENFDKLITLKELSEILSVTPEHLCSLFKNATGLRVFEYINNLRIKNSKELLISNKEMQIKEISKICGFDDTSYFCSVFKRFENISPTQFRKLH